MLSLYPVFITQVMIWRRFASTATSSFPPTISQLLVSPPPPSSRIQVHGWVKSIRRQRRLAFAIITDGSSQNGLQAVFSEPALAKRCLNSFFFVEWVPIADEESIIRLTNGASVQLSGRLTESPGPKQANELQVEEVVVLGECDPDVSIAFLYYPLFSILMTGCSVIQFRNRP
jgi:asparaginyl-tRNA synthetase